jgi:P27 family predicted phage terminase small subunit
MTDTRFPPPPGLDADGRRIWADYLELALARGVIARISVQVLERLTDAAQQYRRATALVRQTDILIDQGGKPRPNPALQIQDKAGKAVERLERQLGLHRRTTPAYQPSSPIRPPGVWFCDQHGQWHGTCHKRDGSPCHGAVMEGLAVCKVHGGGTMASKVKHLAAVQARVNPIAGQPMNITPAQALLWRIGVAAGEVARLDETVAALQAEDLTWGRVTESDSEETGKKTVYGARLSLWVQLRAMRERELRELCEASLRAGVEERLVRVAEMQGAAIAKMLILILTEDFGHDRNDPRIAEVLPRRLRELTAS